MQPDSHPLPGHAAPGPLPASPASSPLTARRRSAWRRPIKIVGGLVVLLLGLFLLYALSFGPAMAKNQRGELPVEFLERFYVPLAIVCDMTGTQGLLERYVALWVTPDPTR
ncbi:MAG: hypothetical protein IT581_13065 [Verrucomicrobiales bacterium]|nr:hypothetical protein [Verrucomicrobiales bacterium]